MTYGIRYNSKHFLILSQDHFFFVFDKKKVPKKSVFNRKTLEKTEWRNKSGSLVHCLKPIKIIYFSVYQKASLISVIIVLNILFNGVITNDVINYDSSCIFDKT